MNENNFNIDDSRDIDPSEMSNEFVEAPKKKAPLIIAIVIILLIVGFASFIFITLNILKKT